MAFPSDYSRLSASAIGRAIAAGDIDPVALAEDALSRAEASRDTHVFLSVTRDRAMREAEASRRRVIKGRPLSPLDGVPVAWKDLFDLEGEVTSAASPLLADRPPAERDAAIVANASAAGMVTVGKTNLTEFAYSGIGLNPHYGTPANPFREEVAHAPGGSSSGSAVAVSSNVVPCAFGTDTAGSVRVPAAFNALVGYKTSNGRFDMTGVFPLSRTLDTLGPLARTTEDCILLDAVARGASATKVRRQPVDSLRLVVPETVVLDDLQAEVSANFEESLECLATDRAVIERCPIDEFQEAAELAARIGTITAAEAYVLHRERIDGDDCARIDSRVVDRILAGKRMTAADLLTLQQARHRLIASISANFGDVILAMPAVAVTAPEIAPLEADKDFFHTTNLKVLRNTILGSFLDMPGVTLPNGVDRNGLPTSLLLSAATGRDDYLLGAALCVEASISGTSR